MSRQTPLHASHVAAGGKLVDFAGWQLPINYGSQIEEHHVVRRAAGVFDVSHMTIVDLAGDDTAAFLRTLLSCDVGKLADGDAAYGCLCNEQGGVIDDVIAYRRNARNWRLIVNAATRDKDLAWLESHRPAAVELTTPGALALLAIQGPDALEHAVTALAAVREGVPDIAALERFTFAVSGAPASAGTIADALFVARTGYTGEDGVEIALPASEAPALWDALLRAGVRPCGLGARDTLRLEAGMSLYGVDLDEAHTPIESGLAWTVDLSDPDRAFLGRETLARQKANGGRSVRVGLVLDGRGVLRGGQAVQLAGRDVGTITSGTFSPTRQRSIALARVASTFDGHCDVLVRDRPLPAKIARVPFVRAGQPND